MKQNKYYTMNPPYQYREEYKDARFTSHSFRTGKTLAHYVDGHTENSTKTYDCCERLVNEGVFKRLSYKEAMAMIKPVCFPRYFTNINGFNSDTVFLKCYNEADCGRSYQKDGTYKLGFTLFECLSYVKLGDWKEITKDEAYALLQPVKTEITPPKDDEIEYYKHKEMFIDGTLFLEYNKTEKQCYCCNKQMKTKNGYTPNIIKYHVDLGNLIKITREEAYQMLFPVKKDDEDEGDLSNDTYAIRCFLNGDRKFTDKLTQKEAYVFRKAASNLYNYLTKEYKLSSPKKD